MAELSSNEQFNKVVTIADGQLKKKKIQIRFGPHGKIRFIIDEDGLKVATVESGIDEAVFREIFHNEVGPLLEAVIRNAVEHYVENGPHLHDVRGDPKARAARQTLLRERASVVEKSLATADLRARYVIKTSSKHPRLTLSNWEIVKKLQLSTKDPWLVPYATLNFETIRPDMPSGLLSLFAFFPSDSIGRSEVCTFDCDEGDLEDLIQLLQDAKAALHKSL